MTDQPIYIFAAAASEKERALKLKSSDRTLRKASFEMILGYDCLNSISDEIKILKENFKTTEISFVCGTSHGSLYATKDFLSGFAKIKRARPFLFQNSLHNSITGFLCQRFELKGPSFTMSLSEQTGESCIETAFDLLNSSFSKACIVLAADGLVEEFRETLQSYVGDFKLKEGAGALILSKEKKLQGLTPLCSITMSSEKNEGDLKVRSPYYDSDCVELITRSIKEGIDEFTRTAPNKIKTKVNLNFV